MSSVADVVIIGAGPYGLSIAAHLRARGVGFRIFGTPMLNWRDKMPKGMLLKSDGFASNLSDPGRSLTLKRFATEQSFTYGDEVIPVPIENFIAYGEAFQRRFVQEVEQRWVIGLDRDGTDFSVRLDDGDMVRARRIVMAIGISDFPYIPPALAGAPVELLSHPADHSDMAVFRGRSLAVIGTGSSAIDLAVLAHDAGAKVQVVTRKPELAFHSPPPAHRSLRDRLSAPGTGIGPGWRSYFYCNAPLLFRRLPAEKRFHITQNSHGPAGGWYMRDRILRSVPIVANTTPEGYELRDDGIDLRVVGANGAQRTISVDHVISATGYRVDMRAAKFLADGLRGAIRTFRETPVLSANFETSVPGFYVVGPACSHTFGPMFRFVHGAEFTAPRIARHLAATAVQQVAVPGASFAATATAKEAAD